VIGMAAFIVDILTGIADSATPVLARLLRCGTRVRVGRQWRHAEDIHI